MTTIPMDHRLWSINKSDFDVLFFSIKFEAKCRWQILFSFSWYYFQILCVDWRIEFVQFSSAENNFHTGIRDRPKLFQIIFDFNPPPNSIEQGLTNRLVPKVSKNSTKNLVKINREVNWFRKMQFWPT